MTRVEIVVCLASVFTPVVQLNHSVGKYVRFRQLSPVVSSPIIEVYSRICVEVYRNQ